jgi:uncharacterized phiE125 gp8 family phage protein
MMLIEETSVADDVLPIVAFKAHLRLGSAFGQDSLQDEVLGSFLRAAMAAIEARTGKVLITRRFGWTLSFWRDASAQILPVAPVVGIVRVAQVGRDGVETDVDRQAYWLERDMQRPRLRASGACLPGIPHAGSVLIEFDAGYGATWDVLPADLRQAVLLLAAHYYEYRDETALSDGCMPFGVSSLLERYKTFRLRGGAAG